MKWTDFSDSPYLSSADFESDEEKSVTIKHIVSEAVGRDRQLKPVAYFREPLKPLTLKQLERLPDAVIAALCASGDLVPANSAYLAAEARA